jgi:hypothetical protein
MATFPVVYSEALPSGQAPAVRANLDVSTGEEAVYRALADMGGEFSEIGQNLQHGKNVTEFNTLKRKRDTLQNEAYSRAILSTDPKQVEALTAEAKRRIEEELKSENPAVNEEFLNYHNQTIGSWNLRMMSAWADVTQHKTKVEAEINDQAALANPDAKKSLSDYTDSQTKQAFWGLITEAEKTENMKNWPNNRRLTIARMEADENPDKAIAIANALRNPTVEQLEIKDSIITHAMVTKNRQAGELQRTQELTSRIFLADLWDSKLTDPDLVTAALRQGWLTQTDAKYLRQTMLNPEPVKTTNKTQTEILEALQNLALGTTTKQEVLSLITSKVDSLSPEDGKGYIKDVYAEPDKENSFWEKEAYQTIEKRLMTLDPLSGRLFGSTAQIDATDRAKIRFDEAVKSAAKSGKPLKGTDYLKKAVEISNQLMPKEKMIISGGQKLPPSEFEEFAIKGEIPPVPVPTAGVRKPIPEESKRAAERLRQRIKGLKVQPAKEIKSPYPDYPDAYEENGKWYVMRNGHRYRIED